MQKIVINRCFGGFSLSPLAVKEIAKLNGRECYFFKTDYKNGYAPISVEEASRGSFWAAFSVPDPQNYNLNELGEDGTYKEANERSDKIDLDSRPEKRDDPNLIKVVEKLGKKSWGAYAELRIVEIPDGVEFEIKEYDGMEHVAEKHRTWY